MWLTVEAISVYKNLDAGFVNMESDKFVDWCLADGWPHVVQADIDRRNALAYDASIRSQPKVILGDKREYYRKEYLQSSHCIQIWSVQNCFFTTPYLFTSHGLFNPMRQVKSPLFNQQTNAVERLAA